jgi:hypothetical protein
MATAHSTVHLTMVLNMTDAGGMDREGEREGLIGRLEFFELLLFLCSAPHLT